MTLGRWQRRLALFASGGLAAAGQAPVSLPFLMLAGMALGFWLILRDGPGWRTAAGRGWWLGFGYFGVGLHWIVEPFLVDLALTGWMAPFGWFFTGAGFGLFWALAAGAGVALGGRGWAGLGGLAAGFGLIEWLREWILTGFPWNSLAQAWVGWAPAQALAWIGPHGLTLASLLMAAAVAGALMRLRLWGGGLVAALLLLAAGFALAPGAAPVADGRPVVRLVQPNAAQRLKWDPLWAPQFFQRLLDYTGARPTPDLVIWPEAALTTSLITSGPGPDGGDVLIPDQATEAIRAAAGGAPVLFGAVRRGSEGDYFNSAVLVDETGAMPAWHDKAHLVPFGEFMPFPALFRWTGIRGLAERADGGFGRGPGGTVLDIDGVGRAQVLICYEGIFSAEVAAVAQRPDVMILMTNDAWFGRWAGPYQHLAQGRMRAIEQGLPMLRAANTGITAVIDGNGRVLDRIGLGEADMLEMAVPPALPPTLYSLTGNGPAVIVLVLLALAAAAARRMAIDRPGGSA